MTDPPRTVINHPETKLEDVRDDLRGHECTGRGRATAAQRGYNTQRLAGAVIGSRGWFISPSHAGWYDTLSAITDELVCRTECKSCVYRYPSGSYGRFRIWQHHHNQLLSAAEDSPDYVIFLYFFVVYTVDGDGVEKEVGKVVAPVGLIDEVLDGWREIDHATMGTQLSRDISWRLLFNRLEVSRERLEAEDAIDLTESMSI